MVPVHDSFGNIIALLDTEGQLVENYRYTSFGETQVFNPGQQINNFWRYSSKRFDPETGFFYFGQRYYAPEVGRWITPDPAGFADGPNLYAYVHNQPLRYIDPDGRFAMFLIPIAVGMAAEYFLPAASVYLAEYAGGTAAAGLLTGLIRGYNGSIFEPSAFDGIDPTAAFLEKGGMCVGTVLSLNLASVAKRGGTAACNAMANLATKELTSAGTNFIAAKVSRSVTWFSSSCARRTAISQTAQKSLQSAEGSVIKGGVRQTSKVDAVIKETLNGTVHSKHRVSANEAVESGMKFLGSKYKELGKPNSGVFRSVDGLRGFRMDNNSLKGLHSPHVPHYHLEVFKSGANKPYISNHVPFYE